MSISDGYDKISRLYNFTVINHPPKILGPFTAQIIKKIGTPLPICVTDEDRDILFYHWAITGDSTGATILDEKMATPIITADHCGNLTMSLVVFDGEDNATATMHVTVVGRNPVGFLNVSNTQAEAGENITFNASKSYDPDGDHIQYRFIFGDGNSTGWRSNSITIHSYGFPGKYNVLIEIKDTDDNMTTTAPLELTIIPPNTPPILSSTNPSNNIEMIKGSERLFSVNAADPEGKALEYNWSIDNIHQQINTTKFLFKPNKSGLYSLRVNITDDKGKMIYFEWRVSVKESNSGKAGISLVPIIILDVIVIILITKGRRMKRNNNY